MPNDPLWPPLPLNAWRETCETLHLWTQIAGKVRMAFCPLINHWWNVALYVNARGLTTSPIPYGPDLFEIQFDFIEHRLEIRSSNGARRSVPLEPQAVADFYARFMGALESMGISVTINTKPQEMAEAIPFEKDYKHGAYDREHVQRFWRVLLSIYEPLEEFRAGFIGKSSPVHFFWGSFDLACTRFSGRRAPARKGVISSEAYSHEVISVGFWPGGGAVDDAAFYAYAVPEPAGLRDQEVKPEAAFWSRDLSEFILMYEDVRRADSPRAALMNFFESTYDAAAKLANWDRRALEREGSVRLAGEGGTSAAYVHTPGRDQAYPH